MPVAQERLPLRESAFFIWAKAPAELIQCTWLQLLLVRRSHANVRVLDQFPPLLLLAVLRR
jgi:hypothetical protein